MRTLFFITSIFTLLCCTDQFKADGSQNSDTLLPQLSLDQKAASEALTQLQMSTDRMNRLYSTFPGIEHSCYPADTIFLLTQDEFHLAMKKFITDNCKNIDQETRSQLMQRSHLAQENYTVHHCNRDRKKELDSGMYSGTWIIPKLLNRRDLIILW